MIEDSILLRMSSLSRVKSYTQLSIIYSNNRSIYTYSNKLKQLKNRLCKMLKPTQNLSKIWFKLISMVQISFQIFNNMFCQVSHRDKIYRARPIITPQEELLLWIRKHNLIDLATIKAAQSNKSSHQLVLVILD